MAYASASQGGYGAGPSVIPTDAAHADVVSISDAELLFTGHFERKGPDLVLTGHDGHHHIIPGYFSVEHPAALVAPNGARIAGDLVELLAGSQAPGQYAQTQAPAPTNAIGRIEKVVGDVTVMRNGVAVSLHVGDAVYKSDVVQTGADSSCGIGFPDGTALNLVANTRMALNDYVYDPNGTSNDALFSLVQGGFAFVAGKVAHTGDMKITTPVATMGIRGTTGYALEQVATVNANLGNVTMSFAIVADPGTDRVGEYELIDQFGNVVARIGRAGEWTDVSWRGANSTPDISTHPMTAANFTLEQQLVPALVEILNSLGNLTPTPQSGPNNPGSSTPPNFELINFQQLLQQNSGTPFTISVPVNGPNGPTATPGTVTISANPETGVSSSTVVNWVAQSSGTWETPANWSGNGVPTAPETVDITLPIKVTIKAAENVSGLLIGAGAILNIVSGGALELSNGISNFGTFQLNSSGADPTLAINGTVYLLDGGEIALKGPTAENLIVGVPGTGATLVNVDNTIIGSGTIGQGDGALILINGTNGTIEAKPFAGDSGLLVIDTGSDATNSGVFTAAAGGTLQIEDHVTNFGIIQALGSGTILLADRITNSGTIGASGPGAMVGLEAAFISGGTLETDTGGVIETLAGASTFLNVSVADGSVIDAGANTVLRLHGSTVLDGTVTFKGQGTFTLGGADAQIAGQAHTVVELDNFGTITGAGNIGGDNQHFMLVNEQSGTIDANGQLTLTIDNDSPGSADTQPSNAVINTGTIEATGIGGLAIVNTTISNASDAAHNTGIVEVTAGSQITLDNATILHGSVTIAAGGEMQTASGTTNTIDTAEGQDNLSTPTLINAGTLLVNDNGSLTLASPDAIDNSGTITLGSTGDATYLYFDQAAAGINGGGHIILSDSTANIIAVTQSGDQLTNFDNTISGAGTIGAGGMVLVNDGVINANQQNAALTLDPAFLANTGTLEATQDATLVLSNTTVSNSSATTQAGGSYSFNNTIDDQLAGGPTAPAGIFGINDAGQVVGNYISGGSHGFLDDITLDGTSANAINDSGEVVGSYSAGGTQSGFLFSNGAYTTLNDPLGTDGTLANGINNSGQIVGEYLDASGSPHGFLFSGGTYTTLDDPLAVHGTDAKGINDAGLIVGYYLDSSSAAHGFIYNNGTSTTLNDPLAANGTFAEGINDAGQVVGYYLDSSDVAHGFVYSNGTYFNFDDSAAGTGAGQGTFALAIDNAGAVSGYYSVGNGGVGFLATPAQSPSSGSIFADSGATVDLVGTSIVGGDLKTAAATNTDAAGLIDVTGNAISAIYDATVTNSGTFSIEQGSQLNVSGTALTGGSLTVAGVLDSIGTSFITDAAITNTGKIDATAGTLTISDPVSFSNTGTIEARGDHSVVAISISGMLDNAGTLLASGDGTMSIDVSGITNESGGVIKADGSSLTIDELGSGSANYGTYEAIDGGILTINHAGSATNYGTFKADGGTIVLNNNADDTNHGTLAAANGGTLDVNLVSDSGSGGGNYATVEAISGGTVAIADGFRNLNGATVEATGDNSRVDFANENVTNAGTMQALDHGTLSFTSAVIDNVIDNIGGTIAANGDFSVVELSDATIAGGTLTTGSLTSDSSGKIEITVAGGADTSVFDGSAGPLTIEGYVRVEAGANLELIGSIDNQGTIDVDAGANPANLEISGTVTLNGSGNVTLDGSTDSIIGASGGGTLDNAGTILGSGTIGTGGLALVNNGTIDANSAHNALTIDATALTNDGTLETTGGTLDVAIAVTGTGSVTITGGGTTDFHNSFDESVVFSGAGTLELAHSYCGTISGFGTGDTVDLTTISYSSSETDVWNQSAGTLTISNGTQTDVIHLAGTYTQNDFALASDGSSANGGHPGTDVVWSPAQGSVSGLDSNNNAVEGSAVTANLTDTNASNIRYTWLDGGQVVQTGTSSSFTPTDDQGHTIDVVVGFTDHGTAEQVTALAGVVADAALTAGTATLSGGVEGVTATALSATFSDANLVAPVSDFSGTINWGDGSPLTSFTSTNVTANGNGTFTVSGLSHLYAEDGTDNVSVTINDVGGSSTTDSGTATVADAALTAGTATVSGGVEGVTATALSATFSDANLGAPASDFSGTIAWGDGNTTAFTSSAVSGSGGSYTVSGSHTYAEEGTYTPVVTINDVGGSSTTDNGTATVADAALTAGTATVSGGVEGVTATALSATFRDANLGAPASDFSGTIAWGDGNTTNFSSSNVTANGNGSYTVSGSHTYAEEGTYTPVVTINDVGGSSTTDSGTATVADAALTNATGKNVSATEGISTDTVQVATFTDDNPNATASDFTATTINWGDGTAATAGTVTESNGVFSVSGAHTYAEEGSDQVSVAITDVGGSTANTTSTATVVDAPLTATGVNVSDTEGASTGTVQVATFTDANPNAPLSDFTATINWGDGTAATAGTVTESNGVFSVSGAHTYAEEGSDQVSVAITDVGGSTANTTSTATVVDAPLTATGVNVSDTEGASTGTVQVATFTDANPNAPLSDFTATINWGDGSASSTGTITENNGVFSVSGAHTYAEEGSDQVSVAITDVGGSMANTTSTATVVNFISFSGGTINYSQASDVYPYPTGYAGPQISNGGNTLQLTDNSNNEYGSWFNNNTYSINSFYASFDYQANGQADGMAFILQDSSAGSSALGGPFYQYGGSGLGYAGISPSAAVEFNMYNSGAPGHIPGTNFAIDGSTGNYNPTSDIPFGNGDEIQVVLSYNGSVLTETLTDLSSGAVYSANYSENLASILGSDTAYVGFSAGTGAAASTQTVSNFAFAEGAVTGANSFTIANGTTLEFGSFVASGTTVSFAGATGTLQLDAAAGADLNISGFTGTAPNSTDSDEIELAGFNETSYSQQNSGGNVTLTVDSSGGDVTFTFANFTASLNVSTDGTNTYIFDPPAKSSGASVSPENDTFVFHPGMGAETAGNFNPQADTIELDHFNNIESVQQLASLITTDAQGDAVLALGHHDSITLPGVSANYLQAHLHNLVHLS